MDPKLLRRILMNLENGASSGGAGTGAAAGAAASSTAGTPAAGAAASGQAAGGTAAAGTGAAGAGAASSTAGVPGLEALQKQLADLTQVVEKLAKPTTAGAAGASSAAAPDAAAITAQVTAQVSFNTAVQLTPGLTPEQQGALRTLFDAEKPAPDKLGEWMKSKLALFGKTASSGVVPPQSSARTDLGQAAGGAGAALPDDPRAIPIEQWKSMDPAKRQEITRKWASRNGGNTGILSRNARS